MIDNWLPNSQKLATFVLVEAGYPNDPNFVSLMQASARCRPRR
jgi:hypothetical protein